MAKAVYYEGLTIETDEFLPILKIEGRLTKIEKKGEVFVYSETLRKLLKLLQVSLFVIADITSPKSSPLELATVPDYQIPFVSIIQTGEEPFSMLKDLIGKYDWVLEPVIEYSSRDNLVSGFEEAIIDRAWRKHQELQKKKMATIEIQSIDDFLKKNSSINNFGKMCAQH
jgi:hypothetical protein